MGQGNERLLEWWWSHDQDDCHARYMVITFKSLLQNRMASLIETFKVYSIRSLSNNMFVEMMTQVDLSPYGPGHAKMCLMPYANNKGADQPAHLHSLISTFVVHCLDSMICILA